MIAIHDNSGCKYNCPKVGIIYFHWYFNINLVTTCMLSLSSFLIIAAIVITSLPAGKEVDSNNPAHKVQQYLTIAGLLL